jgi:hypothetical protein
MSGSKGVVSNRGVRSVSDRTKKVGAQRRAIAEKPVGKICPNCEQPIASCKCEPDDGMQGWMPK